MKMQVDYHWMKLVAESEEDEELLRKLFHSLRFDETVEMITPARSRVEIKFYIALY